MHVPVQVECPKQQCRATKAELENVKRELEELRSTLRPSTSVPSTSDQRSVSEAMGESVERVVREEFALRASQNEELESLRKLLE